MSSSLRQLLRLGPRVTAEAAVHHLFSTRRFLGLRCNLDEDVDVPSGKRPVTMVAKGEEFGGFRDELAKRPPSIDVFVRQRMVEAGVETLYVAEDEHGAPIYAQWLVMQDTLHTLDRFSPGRYPRLAAEEALVEGAYTFLAFRGLGVMAPGMAQLLNVARARGAHAVITYVGEDNVPSLRGCARVGFELDHLRVNRRRLGRHGSTVLEADEAARTAWLAATGR